MDEDKIEKLAQMIVSSDNIVFFGGAGISTESGIPDFRSENGLYSGGKIKGYTPEEMLSRRFFDEHTDDFFDFYRATMFHPNAYPNEAHKILAALEKAGKLKRVITQNIDGLHQAAGSKNVSELHGSIYRNYCMDCDEFYPAEYVMNAHGTPKCELCGGIVKPDVVLYGEMLDEYVISTAVEAIEAADMLIIGGTSLAVYPAASFVTYYSGSKLVLINKSETDFDSCCNLTIHDSAGAVLKKSCQKAGVI